MSLSWGCTWDILRSPTRLDQAFAPQPLTYNTCHAPLTASRSRYYIASPASTSVPQDFDNVALRSLRHHVVLFYLSPQRPFHDHCNSCPMFCFSAMPLTRRYHISTRRAMLSIRVRLILLSSVFYMLKQQALHLTRRPTTTRILHRSELFK
jgi:hypothetical protein